MFISRLQFAREKCVVTRRARSLARTVVVVVVVTFTWGNGERGKKNSLVERFQLQQQRLIVDHIVGDIAAHPVTMLSQGRGIIGGHLVITDVRTVRDTWNKYIYIYIYINMTILWLVGL